MMQIIHSENFILGGKNCRRGKLWLQIAFIAIASLSLSTCQRWKISKIALHSTMAFTVLCVVESSATCKKFDKIWIAKECQKLEGPRGATLACFLVRYVKNFSALFPCNTFQLPIAIKETHDTKAEHQCNYKYRLFNMGK